jgi:hypothetical protein
MKKVSAPQVVTPRRRRRVRSLRRFRMHSASSLERRGRDCSRSASVSGSASMIEIVRYTQRNVKRWHDGDMRKRWSAAGMLVAEQQFRRIIGYRDLAKLVHRDRRRKFHDDPDILSLGRQRATSTHRCERELRVRLEQPSLSRHMGVGGRLAVGRLP